MLASCSTQQVITRENNTFYFSFPFLSGVALTSGVVPPHVLPISDIERLVRLQLRLALVWDQYNPQLISSQQAQCAKKAVAQYQEESG